MKGNNQLMLSKATMIEAIQQWVNRTFREGHGIEVFDVTAVNLMGGAVDFKVDLKEAEKKPQ